jgi:hypothetical protein
VSDTTLRWGLLAVPTTAWLTNNLNIQFWRQLNILAKNIQIIFSKITDFKGNPILTFYRLIFALLEIKKIVKEFSIDILYGNNTKDFVILVFYKIFTSRFDC